MERILRYAAYLANAVLIASALILILHSYGEASVMAALLTIPPILSIAALYQGPDAEERQLKHDLTKARLKKELKDLSGGKS